MSADVELDRVTIRFGDFTAVNSATLKIENGEFFSFLGPSGCGKTTILRTISGFLEPSDGHVRIGGQDMRGIGPNKRPTALIFQNLALFPLMSVAQNIAYGLRVRGASRAEQRRRAEELLALIALPGQGGKKVSELSGGQKQRVAIARALVKGPQIVLADEPTANLDSATGASIIALMRKVQSESKTTFIFASHDPQLISHADEIFAIRDGRIVDHKTGAAA